MNYAAKCKRRRADGPTPCLYCPGECIGDIVDAPPLALDLDALETRHPTLGDNFDPDKRHVIAFTGLAGSGKSTAALRLVEHHGYQRLRFAGPLKSMLAALGLSGEEIDGRLKEAPCRLLGGKTPRWAMQTLGTEWGRELIDAGLWIRAWRAALDRTLPGSCVVVDDCRFPNEAEAIRAVGGIFVRIDRPGAGAMAAGHVSEGQELPVDQTLLNTGSIDRLFGDVDAIARNMAWAIAGTH